MKRVRREKRCLKKLGLFAVDCLNGRGVRFLSCAKKREKKLVSEYLISRLPKLLRHRAIEDRLVFSPDVLPFLIRSLQAFIPPYDSVPSTLPPALVRTLTSADYVNLEESCGLLESLCMDVEDVRLALARGLASPDEHAGVRVLGEMLRFVDAGDYPPHWQQADADGAAARLKGFDRCKAAVIKAIVEVAGDEKNTDVLWDDADPEKPGGLFVDQMVRWIRAHKGAEKSKNRDDLIICATLSLGNVVRKGACCIYA